MFMNNDSNSGSYAGLIGLGVLGLGMAALGSYISYCYGLEAGKIAAEGELQEEARKIFEEFDLL